MKYYNYFPGCSSSHGSAKAYGQSAGAISKALDVELIELQDWNCCGSTPYSAFEELASFCLSARNLALAEKRGFDIVTPCSSCYVILDRTNRYLRQYPMVRYKVNEALAAGGMRYLGTVKSRHLLDMVINDIGYGNIKARVRRDFKGMKIAAYYGCQIVRPSSGFDHPEFPQSLDRLISILGAEPVPFPMKSRCCGGSLIISEEKIALDLMKKILYSAVNNGAQWLVTACPLCQTNLDAYQARVNRRFKTNFKIPILFFTQLMGLAFGFAEKELGLDSCIVYGEKLAANAV